MAVVNGIRERVHWPLYDSISVAATKQLYDVEKTSTLKFFVDVQSKTKLETNMQQAALLPHFNTFEARAMRVVISDLPPEFPEKEITGTLEDAVQPTNQDPTPLPLRWGANAVTTAVASSTVSNITVRPTLDLAWIMDLLKEARDSEEGSAQVDIEDDPDVFTVVTPRPGPSLQQLVTAGGVISLEVWQLEEMIDSIEEKKQPPREQINPRNGAGELISKFIYNTVTTLYVGEKQMITMPTWFFPAGAGPYSETGTFVTHGEPSPVATFRFAEAVTVDRNQAFRVEIEVPEVEMLKELQKIYGPFNIWVVLDGYMTRDVQ
jgi:hypothetical protein